MATQRSPLERLGPGWNLAVRAGMLDDSEVGVGVRRLEGTSCIQD